MILKRLGRHLLTAVIIHDLVDLDRFGIGIVRVAGTFANELRDHRSPYPYLCSLHSYSGRPSKKIVSPAALKIPLSPASNDSGSSGVPMAAAIIPAIF